MGRIASAVLVGVKGGVCAVSHSRERKKFLELYGNPVAAMLQRIYQHVDAPAIDRYLSVTMAGGPYGSVYVQCLFRGDNAFVELSSGFYSEDTPGPPTHRIGPDQLKRLAELGFTTDDSEGNFQLMQDLRDGHPQETADLMLTALFDTYGDSAEADVWWDSPFVHGYDYEAFLEEGEDRPRGSRLRQIGTLIRRMPNALSDATYVMSEMPYSRQMKKFEDTYKAVISEFLKRAWSCGMEDVDRRLLLTCMPDDHCHEYVRLNFYGTNEASYDCISGHLDREANKSGELFPRQEIEDFLTEMLFDKDPDNGMFYGWIEIEDENDIDILARIILIALYLACGARIDSDIYWLCPAVDDPDDVPDSCTLVKPLTS